LRGVKITASDAPGTYLGLKKLLLSFYRGENRWPESAVDLKAFATTNRVPFNLRDYPQLALIPERESNRLKYSYKFLRWTLKDVLDPPNVNADRPNGTGPPEVK